MVIDFLQASEMEKERLGEISKLSELNADLQRQVQTLSSELDSSKRTKNSTEKKLTEMKKKLKDAEVCFLYSSS